MPYIFACCHSHLLAPWICVATGVQNSTAISFHSWLGLAIYILAAGYQLHSILHTITVRGRLLYALYHNYLLHITFFSKGSISINEQATKLAHRCLKLNICCKFIILDGESLISAHSNSQQLSEELHFFQTSAAHRLYCKS